MELCQYPCENKIRRFVVEAIQIPIVYNRYGDHDPNGLLYVLEQDSQRIQKEALLRFQQSPPQPYEEVQPLVLRVNLGDKPRNVSLAIHGHLWREQPKDDLSREIPIQGGISIGNRFDMELKGGAVCPGDYLYRSGSFGWDVESGMWGIFRVLKHSIRCKCKELCGRILKGRK